MPLRMNKPLLSTPDRSVAKIPPKVADPFYHSTDWKTLRAECFKRDGYRCTVPGCDKRAVYADHVLSRKAGGKDELGNLRSLCASHDARVKEDHTGQRRNGGRFEAR